MVTAWHLILRRRHGILIRILPVFQPISCIVPSATLGFILFYQIICRNHLPARQRFWERCGTEGWLVLYSHKKVQFSRTSLSYRPIAALSTGVDRRPRSIRIFAQIRAELFAFLGLWHSAIKRSRVQILDLATQL